MLISENVRRGCERHRSRLDPQVHSLQPGPQKADRDPKNQSREHRPPQKTGGKQGNGAGAAAGQSHPEGIPEERAAERPPGRPPSSCPCGGPDSASVTPRDSTAPDTRSSSSPSSSPFTFDPRALGLEFGQHPRDLRLRAADPSPATPCCPSPPSTSAPLRRGSRKLRGHELPVPGAPDHRDGTSVGLERPLPGWRGGEASAQPRGKMATAGGGSVADPGSRSLLRLLSFCVLLAGEASPPRVSSGVLGEPSGPAGSPAPPSPLLAPLLLCAPTL